MSWSKHGVTCLFNLEQHAEPKNAARAHAGFASPNLGVAADRDPRERGSRPLNTDR